MRGRLLRVATAVVAGRCHRRSYVFAAAARGGQQGEAQRAGPGTRATVGCEPCGVSSMAMRGAGSGTCGPPDWDRHVEGRGPPTRRSVEQGTTPTGQVGHEPLVQSVHDRPSHRRDLRYATGCRTTSRPPSGRCRVWRTPSSPRLVLDDARRSRRRRGWPRRRGRRRCRAGPSARRRWPASPSRRTGCAPRAAASAPATSATTVADERAHRLGVLGAWRCGRCRWPRSARRRSPAPPTCSARDARRARRATWPSTLASVLARLALVERLAAAQDRRHAVLEDGLHLPVHHLVGLAEQLAALGVAGDHVARR